MLISRFNYRSHFKVISQLLASIHNKHVHPLRVLCRDSENSFLLECVSIMYEFCSLNAEIVKLSNVDYITAEQLLKMEFTNGKVLVTYYVRIYNLFYSSV
jgi:uncharacterized membrane protein